MGYTNFYSERGMLHASVSHLMGTRLDALLFGAASLQSLWRDIEAEMRRLEKLLNRFDSESEVARVNSDAQFQPVELSDELWSVLLDCRRYRLLTDGLFDVALGRFSDIAFFADRQSVQFERYGVMLDFGGYGKGYALRRISEMLAGEGVKRGLVNFGNSSTLAIGSHPHGDCWQTGIEDPYGNAGTLATVSLLDASLSVSGNSPTRPQHIVNPLTREMAGGKALIAVVAPDPLDAEVLTTALVAANLDREKVDWLQNFKIDKIYKLQ